MQVSFFAHLSLSFLKDTASINTKESVNMVDKLFANVLLEESCPAYRSAPYKLRPLQAQPPTSSTPGLTSTADNLTDDTSEKDDRS